MNIDIVPFSQSTTHDFFFGTYRNKFNEMENGKYKYKQDISKICDLYDSVSDDILTKSIACNMRGDGLCVMNAIFFALERSGQVKRDEVFIQADNIAKLITDYARTFEHDWEFDPNINSYEYICTTISNFMGINIAVIDDVSNEYYAYGKPDDQAYHIIIINTGGHALLIDIDNYNKIEWRKNIFNIVYSKKMNK
jgi:hypothetical protein